MGYGVLWESAPLLSILTVLPYIPTISEDKGPFLHIHTKKGKIELEGVNWGWWNRG